MSAPLTYTYAVARAFDRTLIAGLRGVDEMPVHLVRYRGIVAVASTIPRAGIDEAALRARLETLDELEALARAHHAVVAALATHTVTLPFRLATIHHGDQRVTDVLRRGYGQFEATLDRLTGRVELGVKVYLEMPAEPAGPAPASGSPGRDYLRRRQRRRHQRDDAWRRATATADRVDAALADLAVDQRRHRPQSARLSGARGENVLNAAYLVDAGQAEQFTDRARRLAADAAGVRVEVTGPWAPYSFAGRRPRRRRGVSPDALTPREVALVDLLDRLFVDGLVLTGDLTLAIADIDLVHISLRALITSITGGGQDP